MEEVYEKLFSLWQKQRSSEELLKIPEELLNELAEYFALIRRQVRLSDKNSLQTKVRLAEFDMMQRLLESLLKHRMRKIIALSSTLSSLENLLPFEKNTFNTMQRVVSQHESMVRNGLNDPRILYREMEHRYEIVVFLKDFPKFVGEDLYGYGPFKSGDVAAICSANVPALQKREIVKPVKSV
ncbi:MAG: hypothetical protein NZ570_00470 [Candidatus Caldarchaeum sp.]|nr:hypothetical protein [Candidatus Caldarchaeum sp.]MDW7978912.1 hypothetical protein [Candidatus Caldarchaeum sp.]MDW8360606.1 hypothetical protein [Candidatus Caldarchaeum sp.]